MGSLLVVVAPPFLDALLGIGQGQEPRRVQALCPQPGVERLDERVVRGCSRPGKVDLHLVQASPMVEQAPGELRPVAHPQAPWRAPSPHELVEDLDHLGCPEVRSRSCREPLSRVDVCHGQNADGSAVEQLAEIPKGICGWVRHEGHRPNLVRRLRSRTPLPAAPGPFAPRQLGANRQAFLGVEPVDARAIDDPPLPAQQHVQPPMPAAHPNRRQVLQPQTQRNLRIAPRPVAVRRASKPHGRTGPPLADLIRALQLTHHIAPSRRPHP